MTTFSATSVADAPGSNRAQGDKLMGIGCGAGAGAVWGLVFLAPELVGEFGPLQLTAGRYFCYGLIAAALIAPRWRALASHLSWNRWLSLIWLAFAGNTLYYVLLSNAVRSGGIAMASLVMGFVPVAVTLIGSRDRGAVPLGKLMPSLLLCVAGAVCIGWQALAPAGLAPGSSAAGSSVAGSSAASSSVNGIIGLLCAIGAMASWTAYAVGNARILTRLDHHVSAHDWNLLTGIVTGAQSIALIPLVLALDTSHHGMGEWTRFAAVSAGLAILASIVGNSLWNRMSRLLPLTLVGQMILFETLFAMMYGFAWERRGPTMLEIAALGFVVTSVVSCLAAHTQPVMRFNNRPSSPGLASGTSGTSPVSSHFPAASRTH